MYSPPVRRIPAGRTSFRRTWAVIICCLRRCGWTGVEYRQVFRLDFPETAAKQALAARQRVEVPPQADFRPLDIAPLFNGDVREIYRQAYLSPRPATISVRIGIDGYSPWTFPHWENTAPEITLDRLAGLRGADGLLRTAQGVPFARQRRRTQYCLHFNLG